MNVSYMLPQSIGKACLVLTMRTIPFKPFMNSCNMICCFKLLFFVTVCSQRWHLCLILLWIDSMWFFKLDFWPEIWSQYGHLCHLFSWIDSTWAFRLLFLLKLDSHLGHGNSLISSSVKFMCSESSVASSHGSSSVLPRIIVLKRIE